MKNTLNLFIGAPRRLLPGFFSLRTLFIFILYTAIIFGCFVLAMLFRFDFKLGVIEDYHPREAFLLLLCVKIFFLVACGQFRDMLTFFHMPDLLRIFWAMFLSSCVLLLCNSASWFVWVPKGVIAVDFILSVLSFGALRMSLRILRERSYRADGIGMAKRVAIIGAGDIGTTIASNLIAHRNLGLHPVIFIDEDPSKQGRQISSLNVIPMPESFVPLKSVYKVDKVIIAIKHISPAKINSIVKECRIADIDVSIIPSTADLAEGIVKVSQIRDVEIEDILDRDPVELNSAEIDSMIKGKVVLVTGAGGSIGGELCRQIAARNPSLLILLDQCEVQLFKIEQDLRDSGYGVTMLSIVADVEDAPRMNCLFSRYNIDIVFHAAAHKHVPMMESQPSEALRNNSHGTWVLANIASEHAVEKFILISTDKAINPTNVMGASKRLAEMFVHSMVGKPGNKTKFGAVRFGNVLGSSGSVIPTFKKQIARGGPLTVTHPDVTRYFMTIPEAVGLVLQCATQLSGCEIFVLDMGKPVKIIDVARKLINLSGFRPDIDIEIKIIGLRPGEKLYEEIQHKDESVVQTAHPRIFGFISETPSYEDMSRIDQEIIGFSNKKSVNEMKEFIHSKVPEYKPQFYQ